LGERLEMKKSTIDAMFFPLLAVLLIAIYAGGLGVIFMVLEATPLHTWGPVILGVALVVGVPSVAALLERRFEQD
jgi:hypothetical protein